MMRSSEIHCSSGVPTRPPFDTLRYGETWMDTVMHTDVQKTAEIEITAAQAPQFV